MAERKSKRLNPKLINDLTRLRNAFEQYKLLKQSGKFNPEDELHDWYEDIATQPYVKIIPSFGGYDDITGEPIINYIWGDPDDESMGSYGWPDGAEFPIFESTSDLARYLSESESIPIDDIYDDWETAYRRTYPDREWSNPGRINTVLNTLGTIVAPRLTKSLKDDEIRSRRPNSRIALDAVADAGETGLTMLPMSSLGGALVKGTTMGAKAASTANRLAKMNKAMGSLMKGGGGVAKSAVPIATGRGAGMVYDETLGVPSSGTDVTPTNLALDVGIGTATDLATKGIGREISKQLLKKRIAKDLTEEGAKAYGIDRVTGKGTPRHLVKAVAKGKSPKNYKSEAFPSKLDDVMVNFDPLQFPEGFVNPPPLPQTPSNLVGPSGNPINIPVTNALPTTPLQVPIVRYGPLQKGYKYDSYQAIPKDTKGVVTDISNVGGTDIPVYSKGRIGTSEVNDFFARNVDLPPIVGPNNPELAQKLLNEAQNVESFASKQMFNPARQPQKLKDYQLMANDLAKHSKISNLDTDRVKASLFNDRLTAVSKADQPAIKKAKDEFARRSAIMGGNTKHINKGATKYYTDMVNKSDRLTLLPRLASRTVPRAYDIEWHIKGRPSKVKRDEE